MPRALVFREYGGPEVQALVELPKPTPGPGELLVAVRAAGVNPVDWKTRAGRLHARAPVEFPAVFGREAAGVVEAVGEEVVGFAPGDEVFGSVVDGAYGEYAVIPARSAAHKPPSVSFTDAAVLPVAAATAYDGVHQLALEPGDTLLVTGIGGGVGIAAAQLALAAGLRVIGTASAAKRDFVESLGAQHVEYGDGVVDRIRALAPDGVDGILDLIGGDDLRVLAELLTDRAKLASATDEATVTELGGAVLDRRRGAEVLEAVVALVESGRLRPFVTATFPLERAGEALAVVEGGHATGKVVVEIS